MLFLARPRVLGLVCPRAVFPHFCFFWLGLVPLWEAVPGLLGLIPESQASSPSPHRSGSFRILLVPLRNTVPLPAGGGRGTAALSDT